MPVSDLLPDMNESKYDNENLIEYLLGALPESETERFDELSFTDEEFAAALNSVEKDLVDAYIRDELTGKTLEKFKSYYLASPIRREKVEFAEAFQVYIERSFAETNVSFAGQSKSKRFFSEFLFALNRFKNRDLMQGSFAALALAFVLLGGWWIINKRVSQQETAKQNAPVFPEQTSPPSIEKQPSNDSNAGREIALNEPNLENKVPQPPIEKESVRKQNPVAEPTQTPKLLKLPPSPQIKIASFFLAPSMRSGSRIPNLSVSEEITGVAMRLQLESDSYQTYQVVLMNESNVALWQSKSLKPKNKSEIKTLNVSLPAKLLKSQIYFLQVSGTTADGTTEIISDYPFRIVRQ